MRQTIIEGSRAQEDPLLLPFLRVQAADASFDRTERLNHVQALTRAIEAEVIPRLLVVSSRAAARSATDRTSDDGRRVMPVEVAHFTDLVLDCSIDACIREVERLHDDGVPMESIFLDLLAPTARRVGDLWTADERSFTDVTIALGVLQQVFRHFCVEYAADGAAGFTSRTAFLVPAPEEQHTFGLFLIETFLHRAGWNVTTLPTYDEAEVRAVIRADRTDLVCLSASCERHVDNASDAIDIIRRAAGNQTPSILVGGVPFMEAPALAMAIGADATALNAADAVARADALVPLANGGGDRCRIN